MIQGTGSNVGKSLVCAGLCRAFVKRGQRVRCFKPQNMSNNAAATDDGGEIGRAQALQAMACGVAPSVHMNPVLLKPESETGAQVIVQGQRWATLRARAYGARKHELMAPVLDSFARISAEADLVIVEGAGSPAEINLRRGDIANMGFAEAADVPVALVGDIDRGGVIASLVGCHAVLPPAEQDRIKAFIINRFRGDTTLFADGMTEIAARTRWQALGIVPHFSAASVLPAEDSSDLDVRPAQTSAGDRASAPTFTIAVPRLPRIANFDDLDPLRLEPGVDVRLLRPGEALAADTDLVLLSGSKSTISDLAALRSEGWDIDIQAHVRRGGAVLGICGGYQMLGRMLHDPDGVEGPAGSVAGLGLLDVETTLTADKTVRTVRPVERASGAVLHGYEIHLGRTEGADCARAWLDIGGRADGAADITGRVRGTYVHGLFADDAFRARFLSGLGGLDARAGTALAYRQRVETTLDMLAAHLEQHLDLDAIASIAARS
ncbi:MAG: cobyric acid synthase [Pseudomonadota bacterium]